MVGWVSRCRTAVLTGAALTLFAAAVPAAAACDGLLPTETAARSPQRPITADDLLRLRDIGQPDGSLVHQPSPLAISPDRTQAAFVITRADPDHDTYCRGLVVVRLDGSSPPRLLDAGGELILSETAGRGAIIPVGIAAPTAPAWSADGRWIAYLRRDGGRTRLWRVPTGGGPAQSVSKLAVDIEAFAWSHDGRHLVVTSRPGWPEVNAEIEAEGRGGWLYDGRILPNMGPRPQRPARLAVQTDCLDPESGSIVPADAADRAAIDAAQAASRLPMAVAASGRRAWTERRDPNPVSPLRLFAADRRGGQIACSGPTCEGGFLGLWWDDSGRELRFLRQEGWAEDHMALYRWIPGAGAPRLIMRTEDVLIGCSLADGALLCLRENATTPRYIVRIDLRTGASRRLFDPNPEYAGIAFGPVERLRWRNDRGLEAWGDLVMPVGHRPGEKLPLIVVQYHSDGFLRGGIGDEYPIHLFAARGFAVLSIERAAFVAASVANVKSWNDFNAANLKGWAERRSLLSSLTTGIDMAVARGDIDSKRIGITGLSDGASTARFALINSPIFAAAAISSCCMDPKTVMTQAGITFADMQRAMGAPPASRDDPAYWQPYSLALNASRLDRPLLMQLSDEEFPLALETFTALREHGQPVEMHVFPDEHHIKSHPAHRRAIYDRSVDWFSFWLQGREDPDPSKVEQYRRWEAMRANMQKLPYR